VRKRRALGSTISKFERYGKSYTMRMRSTATKALEEIGSMFTQAAHCRVHECL